MAFKIPTNLDLVEMLVKDNSSIEIVNIRGYGKDEIETKEALKEILYEFESQKDEIETLEEKNREMEKHIYKLERMLNNRKVKFKTWQDVEDDFWW